MEYLKMEHLKMEYLKIEYLKIEIAQWKISQNGNGYSMVWDDGWKPIKDRVPKKSKGAKKNVDNASDSGNPQKRSLAQGDNPKDPTGKRRKTDASVPEKEKPVSELENKDDDKKSEPHL